MRDGWRDILTHLGASNPNASRVGETESAVIGVERDAFAFNQSGTAEGLRFVSVMRRGVYFFVKLFDLPIRAEEKL